MSATEIDMDASHLTSKKVIRWRDTKFTIVCNEAPGHPSWWSHMDEFTTRDLWWKVKKDQEVLDIGADWGSYTLAALACGAHVIAWSPPFKAAAPIEAYGISLSAWENGFENRLQVVTSGLWSERGWLASMDGMRKPAFYKKRDTAMMVIQEQPGYCSVLPVQRLDDFTGSYVFPDWIKIDTEGCELEVLKGAVETLKKARPRIFVENHPHVLPDAEKVVEEFLLSLKLGYEKVGTRPHYMVSHSLYAIPTRHLEVFE